ncbi:hypothetical protein BD410DRAFT_841384 [Rickenella mellea]|uniref:Crinkler effector protein N-terminal domain-containing protein n=1 Tax=Rickenella mellea TaxID=50990 RepID=A0A4Y7PZD5_9AGAM|nr:hypothetical protein BD410DRAFT_841384 [Rickenella mellea]
MPFPVRIPIDQRIGNLKILVREGRKNCILLRHVDAADLVLWKLNQVIPLAPAKTAADRIKPFLPHILEELDVADKIWQVFPDYDEEHIHIIAYHPALLPLPLRMLDSFIPREETVIGLYQKLKKHKFVHVRGTPGSGKLTLAALLHCHILKAEFNPLVVHVDVWRSKDMSESEPWHEWLSRKGFQFQAGSTLIVDEAQESHYETAFWLVLRNLTESSPCAVITFASYGSAGKNVELTPTPFLIQETQSVSLRRGGFGDGIAIGLFLSREKFNSLMKCSNPVNAFDDTFFDSLYDMTNGHVGACLEVLGMVKTHTSFRSMQNSSTKYSYEAFLTNITTAEFYKNLIGQSIFARGLPPTHELQEPAVNEVFKTLLLNGNIVVNNVKRLPKESPLLYCLHNGWLHNEPLEKHDGPIRYSFSTPLHRRYVQWRLFGSEDEGKILESTIYDFTVAVLSKFSPLNLQPNRMAGAMVQSLPEAQFQDLFYQASAEHESWIPGDLTGMDPWETRGISYLQTRGSTRGLLADSGCLTAFHE